MNNKSMLVAVAKFICIRTTVALMTTSSSLAVARGPATMHCTPEDTVVSSGWDQAQDRKRLRCPVESLNAGSRFIEDTQPKDMAWSWGVDADDDDDGLTDVEERRRGTDGRNPDTDGDGLSDGLEVAMKSDPTNAYSWPGNGVWPDQSAAADADGVSSDTVSMGAVHPDIAFVDQYGQDVDLYQFYGQTILLDFGATYCSPCHQAASHAEEMFQAYNDDGFVIIQVLFDGDETSQAGWAAEYGLTFPVVRIADDYYEMYKESPLYTSSIPFMMLIDEDMTVVFDQLGWSAAAKDVVTAAVEQELYGDE